MLKYIFHYNNHLLIKNQNSKMSIENIDYEEIPHTITASRERNGKQALFIVVDGLDGIGKGEVERALRGFEEKQGRAIYDTIAHSMAWEELPQLSDFFGIPKPHYNTIITAEPTFEGIGKVIREEIVAKNDRKYSAEMQIQAYSINRLVQMRKIVIPALQNGINIIQSRCCAATLTYQSLTAEQEGLNPEDVRKRILEHEGNILQLEYRPDLLIIPTIEDVASLMARIETRGKTRKDDNSEFENARFQGKLKPLFESDWLRNIFTNRGTQVAYINAGISEQSTRNQAVEIYSSFLEIGEIPDTYKTVKQVLGQKS